MKGYNRNFTKGFKVPLPRMSKNLSSQKVKSKTGYEIKYQHHSIVMHRFRKFAILSASNIDGNTWNPIIRKGHFIKDNLNLSEDLQLGTELYDAITSVSGNGKNDFDQGHLTSYQEVLWGNDEEKQQAAIDTFYFTNCVPQHSLLNKGAWKSLEQYILKTQTDAHNLLVSVMTGPVLLDDDPFFIYQINGVPIRIPCAFWKVIYYKGVNGLTCVGFIMSHKKLLLKAKTVVFDIKEVEPLRMPSKEELFMDFKKAGTFQVSVEMIKKICGLGFKTKGVHFPYQNEEAMEIVYERIEVFKLGSSISGLAKDRPLNFELQGLIL
jgi:endonuclease G, mitochondrial